MFLCVAGNILLVIKLFQMKKSIEQIATDNFRKGKEEAADFVRLTIDKVQEDKNKLNEMSDKELLIETMLALGGYGRRLDRIEEKLQGIYNYKAYTEALAEQIKTIAGMSVDLITNVSSTSETVEGFKRLIEAARKDVHKLNNSIGEVEYIKERIISLLESVNNSVYELEILNNKLTVIQEKIEGIYEYKRYLDEIVVLVNKVSELSERLASSITDNDNKVRSFTHAVQSAHVGVDKLNDSISDVENIKERIYASLKTMNQLVHDIHCLNDKITEIVTTTNQVIKTYGDAPMVKLTNIETNVRKVSESSQRTSDIVSLIYGNILETIKNSIFEVQDDILAVKEVIDRTLADEYDYDSVYYKIDNVTSRIDDIYSSISSFSSEIDDIDRQVNDIKRIVDRSLAEEYNYDSVYFKIDHILSDISSLESKIDDVKSAINSF